MAIESKEAELKVLSTSAGLLPRICANVKHNLSISSGNPTSSPSASSRLALAFCGFDLLSLRFIFSLVTYGSGDDVAILGSGIIHALQWILRFVLIAAKFSFELRSEILAWAGRMVGRSQDRRRRIRVLRIDAYIARNI